MTTKEQLQNDLKEAMRSGDNHKKLALRMLLTNIKIAEANDGKDLDATALIAVIQKEIKSRNETIESAEISNRQDMIAEAKAAINVLESYLPEQLSDEKLHEMAAEVINELQATEMKDMGRVMKILLEKVEGRAPSAQVSQAVKKMLTGGK